MLELIERIRERLAQGAYENEAAVSHGMITPLIAALGWDTTDPSQFKPEFTAGRGRVDFALMGVGRKPSVFIEVKQVGRAIEGDRQLFEYAFHQGVPLCILTDGREWSFYLPSGQGSYEDRRVYRLQLDDREPAECERILNRYLARDRVRSNEAFEDAQRDHRDAAGRREAAASLPAAWAELIAAPEELLLDIVADKAEALCGFKPSSAEVADYLRSLSRGSATPRSIGAFNRTQAPVALQPDAAPMTTPQAAAASTDRTVTYKLFGTEHLAATASVALIEILRAIVARDPALIEKLAAAVRTRTINHIARTPTEIHPHRPDLARAAEIAPGWLVGLNISNRQKMVILREAATVYDLTIPGDLTIQMPNVT